MSIETSTVRVGDLSAYLARPTTGSMSGMLLLPMVTGIGEQVRAWADELAERGFTALAWDVFHGISTDNTPREELAATVDGEVPEWIERLYQSYDTTAETAPASASVLALGESLGLRLRKLSLLLSKMEALGWSIQPRRWDLLASIDLDEIEAQAQLEAAGVWVIARQHAPVDQAGNVRWSHGLIP